MSAFLVEKRPVRRHHQRVSVYLLGDFDPDDGLDEVPTLTPSAAACNKSPPPLHVRRAQAASQRKRRRSEPSAVPTSPVPSADQATSGGGGSGNAAEVRKSPEVQLNSMDRLYRRKGGSRSARSEGGSRSAYCRGGARTVPDAALLSTILIR